MRRLNARSKMWLNWLSIRTQMVSNFRMYLANRMGSFAEQSLHTQEQDVDLLYVELGNQIAGVARIAT